MNIMTWNHTRTNKPMKLTGNMGFLMVRIMMIRTIYPNHPIFINGKPF